MNRFLKKIKVSSDLFLAVFKKKSKKLPTDRRRESRYQAEDEFTVEFKGKGPVTLGSSRDISIHGIRFATTQKLKVNDAILLNLRLPQKFEGVQSVKVVARVARIYKPRGAARYRVGCSLAHENEESKNIIRQFIRWLEYGPEVHKLDSVDPNS